MVFRLGVLCTCVIAWLATQALRAESPTSPCSTVRGCCCERHYAHCRGNGTVYAQAVQALPSDLETFVFTMFTTETSMSLNLSTSGGLARFKNLQVFQIQPYSQEIQHNYVYSIRPGSTSVLCTLTNLRELHLNARLSNLKPDDVQCLQALETLDLSNTLFMNADDLKAVLTAPLSRHITTLLLRNFQQFAPGYIPEVNFATLFRGLNLKNLRTLDLADNALVGLQPGLLLMPRLRKLDISNNLIRVQAAFSYLTRVTLYEALYHPSLRELLALDQGFTPIKKQSTYLGTQHRKAYKRNKERPGNIQLKSMSSRAVSLPASMPPRRNAGPDVIQFSAALHSSCIFDVQSIPIGRHLSVVNFSGFTREAIPYQNALPSGTLCFNPDNELRVVDFSNMQLALFVSNPTLSNFTCSGLTKLEVINLRSNGLRVHYRTILTMGQFPSLHTLLLGDNRVKLGAAVKESNNSIKATLSLRHLDLSRNRLSTVPRTEFLHFPNLQILDLSGNQLQKINLQLPASLRLLNISGNKLTLLRQNLSRYLDTFRNLTVDMTNNNFVCGCTAYHFVHWIHHTRTKFANQQDLYCYAETGQKRLMRIDLHSLYKKCNPMTPLELGAIGAAVSVVLCLTLMLIFIIYRRRWRIRYYFYRRRLRRQWAELNDDYEYDAFVAYSDESPEVRRWVNVTMQTELEQNCGLRLFLHMRDLLGGGFVLERIDDAMRRCRKTVLVLSPEFLQSRLCLYQAWSAHTSMMTEQRDAVVLVKLRSLPIAGITGTLKNLLEIRDCLTWTEDSNGQELFWERVKDALLSPAIGPIDD